MSTGLTLEDVLDRRVPPTPWGDGDNIPWDEPGFSRRMLREHLSQDHDLASRREAVIDRQVRWLDAVMLGHRPGSVLDLACGPGLYAHRLAALGHRCVGIDFGPAAIEHARSVAKREALSCSFEHADIREASFGGGFDAVLLLYGQINVFRRREAEAILERAHAALAPGGRLVLEPQTFETVRGRGALETSWSSARSGLFSPRPHLSLHERHWDDSARATTERWHIVDVASGRVGRYAMTTVAYDAAELSTLFERIGFTAVEILEALSDSTEPASAGLFGLVGKRGPAR